MPNESHADKSQIGLPTFFKPLQKDVFKRLATDNGELTDSDKPPKRSKKMRFVGYARISSEEQVGNFSIDAQTREIKAWVKVQGGVLTNIYIDEAQSGRTSNRPQFQQMRTDARKRMFDAVVVHKFDRFSRNRTDSLAIKALLRHDYGIKVFSVTEPSEDSDGPMGALIEGIMESVADWYSRNLSAETSKGKKERSLQGMHNNAAPFGYKKNEKKILIPDENEVAGLRLAFEKYATGKESDTSVAKLLNEAGYKSKTGRPFSNETVRSMLQNQTYLGKVRYSKSKYRTDGSRVYGEIEWHDGKHDGIIDDELFKRCQAARASRRTHQQSTKKYNPFPLRALAYCYECACNPPEENPFRNYGKLRAQSAGNGSRYYRCRAHQLGYKCNQKGVHADNLENEVIGIIKHLKPKSTWRTDIRQSFNDILGEDDIDEKTAEIKERMRRMDMRWDNGFIPDEQEYFEQRLKLQYELEELIPIPQDDLEDAANVLGQFDKQLGKLKGDLEEQGKLIGNIVERVYVQDKAVVAMTLKSNCHLVLGHKVKEPTSVEIDPFYTNGNDGI